MCARLIRRFWEFINKIASKAVVVGSISALVFLASVAVNTQHFDGQGVNNQTNLNNTFEIKELNAAQYTVINDPSLPSVYIEINIPATEMTLFEGEEEIFSRPVAIGSNVYPTPEHSDEISIIEWNPWWYPPDSDWAKNEKPTPPGPRNPLGPVKLRIGQYGEILLHGTNKTQTVGTPASHGCMRMFNQDARGLAWFLQKRFSIKNDPSNLEMYKKNSGTTYRVVLDTPVPVKLVYRPVDVKNDKLIIYPDHYRKYERTRKSAIITALIRGGIDLSSIDDSKIENLKVMWPKKRTEVPIEDLLIEKRHRDLALAPECS